MILPNVYLVASNPTLTYLIDCGPEGVAIIDPGIVQDYSEIIANVEKLGFSKSRIRWVLNTHAHFDHSGSDYLFRKLGAQILIGAADADAVEKATLVTALNFAYGPNAPPFNVSVVDHKLSDGEVVHLGNKVLTVIHTPGHTEGSSCFFLRVGDKNVLFSGDTVLFDDRLGFQGTGFSDNRAYVQSLEKLAKFQLYLHDQFRWDVLLPGHGTIVLDRAYMDVEKDWHTVELDLINGSPIEALPFSTPDYRVLMYGRP
jgi:glyoxylase-like metal-dependent hydrolase (beta-lactamase superfamily II)